MHARRRRENKIFVTRCAPQLWIAQLVFDAELSRMQITHVAIGAVKEQMSPGRGGHIFRARWGTAEVEGRIPKKRGGARDENETKGLVHAAKR